MKKQKLIVFGCIIGLYFLLGGHLNTETIHNAALREAKKVSIENGYRLDSEKGYPFMNGDSGSFELMDKAIKEGGYMAILIPGLEGYYFYKFDISKKNGTKKKLCVVMSRNLVYGAYIEDMGGQCFPIDYDKKIEKH
ncbi:MAG: hypothetical protein RR539_09070 [Clostridium sp.]|uniref:hypothetical protein n=1 Tax=Clostridium sp. TaxID=1506 RepID=UPI002FC84310